MTKTVVNARRSIFSAARELLEAGGYETLSMRGVAVRSGVALGTIYNYYRDKRELVSDMMTLQWVAFTARQAAVAATGHPMVVKLFRVYQEFRRFMDFFPADWALTEADDAEGGYAERLAALIEAMLEDEARDKAIRLRLGARDTARFVAMNFVAMCRIPGYHYELFEGVVKELL